jgi:hypothetical protein
VEVVRALCLRSPPIQPAALDCLAPFTALAIPPQLSDDGPAGWMPSQMQQGRDSHNTWTNLMRRWVSNLYVGQEHTVAWAGAQ